MTKDEALHVARVAMAFRRKDMLQNWLDAQKLGDCESMDFWAQAIRDLNDAVSILLNT